jgi:hypothetical protein
MASLMYPLTLPPELSIVFRAHAAEHTMATMTHTTPRAAITMMKTYFVLRMAFELEHDVLFVTQSLLLEQHRSAEPQSSFELQTSRSQLERHFFICLQQYRPLASSQSEFDSQPSDAVMRSVKITSDKSTNAKRLVIEIYLLYNFI